MDSHGVSWGQAEMGHLVGAASILLRRGVSFLWQGTEGLGPAFPGWQGQLDLRRHDGEEAVAGAAGTVRAMSLATPPLPQSQASWHSRIIMVTLCLAVQPGLSWRTRGLLLSGGRGTLSRFHNPQSVGGSRPWALRAGGSRGPPRISTPCPTCWLLVGNSSRLSRFWGGEAGQRALGMPGPYPRALCGPPLLTFALGGGHWVAGRLLGLTWLHRGVGLAGGQKGD